MKCVHAAFWSHRLNKNVFSDCMKRLYDKSGCLRPVGRYSSPGLEVQLHWTLCRGSWSVSDWWEAYECRPKNCPRNKVGLWREGGREFQLTGPKTVEAALRLDVEVWGTSRLPRAAEKRDMSPVTFSNVWHTCIRYDNNNNNNNNHDDIYSAVIYGASHMREFTVVLGRSRSAPGGCQLVGQAADLTFEFTCRLL